jgi:hypothetical protein
VEQSREHRVDVTRGPEDALDTGPPAARPDDREIAGPGVPETVTVDDERYPRLEVRLTDDELSALVELDDDVTACGRLITHLAQSRAPRV